MHDLLNPNGIKIGDLIETTYCFGSSIDVHLKNNKICFLLLDRIENENEKWFYGLPQFALNEQGRNVLEVAEKSGYPNTRTGYWLLDAAKCKQIADLQAA